MAEIHEGASVTPGKLELLAAWMPQQRWYTRKGHVPSLRRIGGFRCEDPAGRVGAETLIVVDEAAAPPVIYQVPVTYRDEPLPDGQEALIGTCEHSVLGTRYVYDACRDPRYVEALVELATAGGTSDPGFSTSDWVDAPAVGTPALGVPRLRVTSSSVLRGEQSNTSIIVDALDETAGRARPLIVKVFRVLHEGDNPDVVLQSALAAAGSHLVPAPLGSVAGQWASLEASGGVAKGHLAFAQEFLPGTQDAWRVAAQAVANGTDFTARARDLGAATAQVHRDLAVAMPTVPADAAARGRQVSSWRQRAEAALDAVPELSHLTGAIDAVFAAAAAAAWPPLQRIHGDYHLGQVLDVPGRGWVLLDFEGEPMRPLAERSQPDLPLRDVAGMLRSFDYAAGSRAQAEPADADAARTWARACRHAFLDGYAHAADDPRTDADAAALLRALELDKALYEVVYEARNRPAWVPIPASAIEALCTPTTDRSETFMTTPTPSPAATPEPVPMLRPASWDELGLLVHGGHGNPHGVLGAHPWNGGVTVRVLRPHATSVQIELPDGSVHPMAHDFEGIWQVRLEISEVSDYRVLVDYGDGFIHRQDDPYRFLPTLGEIDLHLIGEGRHEELWKVLGSHLRRYDGPMGSVAGTSFAVWAPHARAVRVVGDFNTWDGSCHPMRALGSSGVWELFVPGIGENTLYKYEILGADGYRRTKADPLARATECPPATASVVTASTYQWQDESWMEARASRSDPQKQPMSIYEVHLGSWRQGLTYLELADQLVDYVTEMGFTHVELLPVMEHPYGPSWGYQVTGYFAPSSRFGSPDEFRHLVDTLHQAGIGVILDWVPAHFPKDGFALGRFDGQALYEHPDPRRGEHTEWGTYIFDFGRPQVRNFLVANASYWLEEFHCDGLRVDAVASMLYLDYSRNDGEWLPNQYGGRENLEAVQFLQEMNATVYRRSPGVVTIAEESTSWSGVTAPTYTGGLGFGLKWNMGWMHDTLEYIGQAPIYRQYHHHEMTFAMVYAYSENFVLPISHDEVVHGKGSMIGKMSGDDWEKRANLRAYFAWQWSFPGKQLLFMGSEFAQYAEWADGSSLDWWLLEQDPHRQIQQYVRDLNALYRDRPALWSLDSSADGFAWIDANDSAGNTFSFLRYGEVDTNGARPIIACVTNFSGSEHQSYRIGLPAAGTWREILNSDATEYGGAGTGNMGRIEAEAVPWHGQPFSAVVTVQKLSSVWFEPEAGGTAVVVAAAPADVDHHGVGISRPELSSSPVQVDDEVDSGLGQLPSVTGQDENSTR
ncbi:1,4-alpha-glucan branching enzyme GlgB [Austwickia sp. TVS 96-490-7B]|uniref:1,4-alpha-glucan branching protein GlgB n=1 Tax=Austwickia sp. TVS 96-490-7B TaxID=2830843 RepID=UPI001C595974|nr:1,4-alpha-glucan branching protein GlgB [Austwickia sp. TVS 96-490-7B]MBW3084534.1 1,4-alpha-glucan branching enzyme GlgB [Austwickia sp. TVS 96-490-7B]